MSFTTRHLRAVDAAERPDEPVVIKLHDLGAKIRRSAEQDILRALARGLRAGEPVVIPSDLLAEKLDSMADEISREASG